MQINNCSGLGRGHFRVLERRKDFDLTLRSKLFRGELERSPREAEYSKETIQIIPEKNRILNILFT